MLVSTHPDSPASAGQRVLRLQCQNQTRIHSPTFLHPSISGGQIYGKLPTKKMRFKLECHWLERAGGSQVTVHVSHLWATKVNSEYLKSDNSGCDSENILI